MKAGTAAKVGLLVVWALPWLSGCANPASTALVQPGIQAGTPVPSAAGEEEEIQSLQEQSLVLLFRGLLLMDDAPQLGIRKDQAQSMLPLVEHSADNGQMSSEDKQRIVSLLTKAQRDFLAGTADKLRRSDPEAGSDRDLGDGTEESVEQQLLDRLAGKLQ